MSCKIEAEALVLVFQDRAEGCWEAARQASVEGEKIDEAKALAGNFAWQTAANELKDLLGRMKK